MNSHKIGAMFMGLAMASQAMIASDWGYCRSQSHSSIDGKERKRRIAKKRVQKLSRRINRKRGR